MERAEHVKAKKQDAETKKQKKLYRRCLLVFILLEVAQWATACIVIAGLVLELKLKADWCYTVITGGAILWAIIQKIRHPHYKKGAK